MDEPKRERWEELAELLTNEHDTERLLKLTQELTKALAERDKKNPQQNSAA